jgi:hypothetical protein
MSDKNENTVATCLNCGGDCVLLPIERVPLSVRADQLGVWRERHHDVQDCVRSLAVRLHKLEQL